MNEEKFNGMAGIYTKYRPAYPVEFIDYLYTEVGFSNSAAIADIGSGTGIFSELMIKQNSIVYAVEPNDDMRGVAEKNLAEYKNFISVNAAAENTSLDDSCVSFITAAQSFHWFDRPLFKKECRRILKDNGKVVLVWNSRDSESEQVRENDEINKRYCPNFKGFTGGTRGGSPDEFVDFFKGGSCEYKVFRNDLFYNEEGFIGRNLSASYALKELDTEYNAFVDDLKTLFKKHSIDGQLRMPNLTVSFVGDV